ncbi:probable ubiquitin carboxyl-terminal hydrolase FAF-Y [Paramacrobiotus metropolitanus]|uniref:probable ubiquitin carboxyl-terminal hydrolase FAF-Y n=1 Tax=Paramacrobiotus metropolitanus TaxID=2943436 RepID=UPI002445BDBF|nr:probable ubiquitin carboxyl-terminal hydrolase FAF-Y [Paramacrobiotus metropolitanus]
MGSFLATCRQKRLQTGNQTGDRQPQESRQYPLSTGNAPSRAERQWIYQPELLESAHVPYFLKTGQPADERKNTALKQRNTLLESHCHHVESIEPPDSSPELNNGLDDFLFPIARVLVKACSEAAAIGDQGCRTRALGCSVLDNASSDPFAFLKYSHQGCQTCHAAHAPGVTRAFDLISELCMGSATNVRLLDETLALFYADAPSIIGWEHSYCPPVAPHGFVGLKNAGATGYMNCVLQQLFMIPSLRDVVLTFHDMTFLYGADDTKRICDTSSPSLGGTAAQEYNTGLIKHLQGIFRHLAYSKHKFYTPAEFWKHFRLDNEPINLREPHDAMHFYNCVVDSVDEGLKSIKKTPFMSRIFGGIFADQRICRDCPHRYSRELPFTSLYVDIRISHTLQDAIELYVKGDLLEGVNAYECEKCKRKVVAKKRFCIKKLPPVLTFHLRRFDYDWEREEPIKLNDYFEFPREIDMEPYTAAGLAKREGEEIPGDESDEYSTEKHLAESPIDKQQQIIDTNYRLVGIVIHSGTATWGQYYSYILDRNGQKWYFFSDESVTESTLDDDKELKKQCFGGGHPNSSTLKTRSAYILFYEHCGQSMPTKSNHPGFPISTSIGSRVLHLIPVNQRTVILKENLNFLYNRAEFVPEYFEFFKKFLRNAAELVSAPVDPIRDEQLAAKPGVKSAQIDEFAVAVIQFSGKILFDVVFRMHFDVRGEVSELTDSFVRILKVTFAGRQHFTERILLKTRHRIFDRADCPCPPSTLQVARDVGYEFSQELTSLGDLIFSCCMNLLEWQETDYYARQLDQYFGMIHDLAASGSAEQTLPNPYAIRMDGEYAITASPELVQQTYMTDGFLKKFVEECLAMEEVRQMIKFLSWENSNFTVRILCNLLTALDDQRAQDWPTLLDFCFSFISLEDSLINMRVDRFLTARDMEHSEGFLSIMLRHRSLYPRRAYLYFKTLWRFLLSHLYTPQESVQAADLAGWRTSLDGEIKLTVTMMCEWLQQEIKSGYSTYCDSLNNPIISSDETWKGLMFERTASAKDLLENIIESLPEDALLKINNQAGSPPDDEKEETNKATA